METINAIAKVRFASAKPQRVQLGKSDELDMELICMEAGQSLEVRGGQWNYYVVTGTAEVSAGKATERIGSGQAAIGGPEERHTLTNVGDGRLILLASGRHK